MRPHRPIPLRLGGWFAQQSSEEQGKISLTGESSFFSTRNFLRYYASYMALSAIALFFGEVDRVSKELVTTSRENALAYLIP